MLLDARIIVLPVNNLVRARTWYTSVLRFAPERIEPRSVVFNGGGYELHLNLDPRARRRRTQAPLIYWRVNDLETALRRFIQTGAAPQSPDDETRKLGHSATVVDPFGNVIGLVQENHDRIAL
ncbi:MAG TPA: VOC family protein [Opitutaceae bacterium]|nr:VOC family protein [Opitutaceae bacterium]